MSTAWPVIIGQAEFDGRRSCPPPGKPIAKIVSWLSTSSPAVPLELDGSSRTGLASFLEWVAASRAHRVIVLVLAIWLLNAFDLTLTIMSHKHGLLDEQNPVAREMLKAGVLPIMLYKVGMVLMGSYPLLRFRRHRICELGALVVLAAYALLAVRWSTCYELYSLTASDSLNLAEFNLANRGFP